MFARTGSSRYREWWIYAIVASLLVMLVIPLSTRLGVRYPVSIIPLTVNRHGISYPLVNPNHMAIFLGMLAPLVIAQLALRRGPRTLGPLFLLLATNFVLFATASRGGIAIAVCAQLVMIHFAVRKTKIVPLRYLYLLPLGGLFAGMLFAFTKPLLWQAAQDSLQRSSAIRANALVDALHMIRDHLWLGTGRGAFHFVFTQYSRAAGQIRHGYLESEYIQLLADTGLFGALFVATALFFAVRRIWRSQTAYSLNRIAATVGLVALAAHNCMDFSWETTGVAIMACALASIAFDGMAWELRRGHVFGLLAATIALQGIAVSHARVARQADEDLAELWSLARDSQRFDTAAADAFVRHPFDGFTAASVADILLTRRDPSAALWLDRALELGPRDPYAHRLTARALALAGAPEQAAVELKLAFQNVMDRDFALVLAEARRTYPTPAHAESFAAALPTQREFRIVMQRLSSEGNHAYVVELAPYALEQFPSDGELLRIAVGSCVETANVDCLRQWLPTLTTQEKATKHLPMLARGLALLGEAAKGEALLMAAYQREPGFALASALADLLMARNDLVAARKILADALTRATDSYGKSLVHTRLSQLETRAGNVHRAEYERTQAARLRGSP